MKKSTSLTLSLAAISLLSSANLVSGDEKQTAAAHPDTTAWEPLFTEDLSNADTKAGVWSIKDGVLTANADEAIWSKVDFKNFQLDLEFKTADGTNSGVVVYATDTKNWIPNSVEIQIADDYSDKWGKADKKWQCAAIFGRKEASEQKLVKKPGEWNRMTVTCRGPKITVALNGKTVTDVDMKQWTDAKTNPDGTQIPEWLNKPMATMATQGKVGLQGKHADATIFYRNIRIKAEK